ncbi:MAG: hypothetical protein QF475_03480 [Candidatus Undinarchaeales archaeon]|jgi:uncharacterized membrane protein|nr:hypothetical protein [Candidatus Undinarchaeales archaeon]
MKMSKQFLQSEILRPSVILVIGTLLFLAVSAYVPGFKGFAIIIGALGAFVIGELIGFRKFKGKKFNFKYLKTVSLVVFIIALAALYIDFFSAGGIPIFNTAIRRFLNPWLTSIAFLMVPANALLISAIAKDKNAKIKTLVLIIFTAGMMALLGYRTEVLAALISGGLVAYYCEIFKTKEILTIGIIAILAFSGMTLMRGSASTHRFATTVAAFDFIAEEAGTFGISHGSVQFSEVLRIASDAPVLGGRHLIGRIIGARRGTSITSMLYGPPFADFGLFALVEFLIFGLIAGAGYKAAKKFGGVYAAIHAIILTFLVLGIETGITDLIIWSYVVVSGGFLFYSHFKPKI